MFCTPALTFSARGLLSRRIISITFTPTHRTLMVTPVHNVAFHLSSKRNISSRPEADLEASEIISLLHELRTQSRKSTATLEANQATLKDIDGKAGIASNILTLATVITTISGVLYLWKYFLDGISAKDEVELLTKSLGGEKNKVEELRKKVEEERKKVENEKAERSRERAERYREMAETREMKEAWERNKKRLINLVS
ncbi:hypothetical protein BGX38DRAFT_1149890 [Terfezia claveryi]|nr:hypothetical protein BGX38DRAFT_1149890 [Terfezia claveryi]